MRPRSLSKKLVLGLVLLIVVQSAFVGIYYYRSMTSSYMDNAILAARSVLNSNQESTDMALSRIREQADKLAVSNDLYLLIQQMHGTKYVDVTWTAELKRILYAYFGEFRDILDVNLLTPEINYSYSNVTFYSFDDFENSPLYSPELLSGYYQRWVPSEMIKPYLRSSFIESRRAQLLSTPVFRLVKRLNMAVVVNNNIQVLPNVYIRPLLVVDIRARLFDSVFTRDLPTPNSRYLIASNTGDVIAASDSSLSCTKVNYPYIAAQAGATSVHTGQYAIDGRQMLVFSSASSINGWVSAVMVPVSDVTAAAKSNLLTVMAVVSSSMLMMLALIILFVQRTVHPVAEIARKVEEMPIPDGALTGTQKLSETDVISHSIDSMNKLIEKLMRENTEIARREQEATILSLEMQINPHFLYNSLSKIYLALHNAGQDELAENILSLSSVLRYSIDSREHVVFLYNDLSQLNQYITASRGECDNRYSVYFDIDPALYNSIVPKMLLQPFVENSILHGFKNMKNGGVICIAGRIEDGVSVFMVEDNGEGIPVEKLYILTDGSKGHIGCANVNRRIKLLYGDRYGVSVQSDEKTTRIVIRLPFIAEGAPIGEAAQ